MTQTEQIADLLKRVAALEKDLAQLRRQQHHQGQRVAKGRKRIRNGHSE